MSNPLHSNKSLDATIEVPELTAAEIQALLPLTREQAVDALIHGIRATPTVPPPDWVNGSPVDPDNDTHKQALPGVWYGEMAATTSRIRRQLFCLPFVPAHIFSMS